MQTRRVRRAWARLAPGNGQRARRVGRTTGAALIVVAGCLSFASPAFAANVCGTNGVESVAANVNTCTYTTSGQDTFNAPLFVTAVHVVAVGQTGGIASTHECNYTTGTGGAGARVVADLSVTQPALFVEVPSPDTLGGSCSDGMAFSGGGGGGAGVAPGGGASVVQTCSVSPSCELTGDPQTDPRLVVGGGGGGAAFAGAPFANGSINGGNAGSGNSMMCNPGQSGQGAPLFAVSGGGGGGGGCVGGPFGGGAAGSGGFGTGGSNPNGHNGNFGGLGAGGSGGAAASDPGPPCSADTTFSGAGGGSGFFGGGGGGGAASCNGGGGGGGSSHAAPSATNVSMTLDQGATPSVRISWNKPLTCAPSSGACITPQFLTGRAFGLSFTQSAPNPNPVAVVDADTGFIQTSLTYTTSAPCQNSVNSPVAGTGTTITELQACAEVQTTGGLPSQSNSIAVSQTKLLELRISGLPTVTAFNVLSGSKSTCAGSTGFTSIGLLRIGNQLVVAKPQVVPPNTQLTVGPYHLNLNAQTPFTLPADKGLYVDAIELSVGPPSSVTAHLTVASAESDIGNCPGEVPIP